MEQQLLVLFSVHRMLIKGAVSKWLHKAIRGSAFCYAILEQGKTAQRKAARKSVIFRKKSKGPSIIRQEKTLEPQARFPSGLFVFYDVSAGYSAPN